MFFTAYDLCGSSLVKIKAEGHTVELQYSNYNTQIKILANPVENLIFTSLLVP